MTHKKYTHRLNEAGNGLLAIFAVVGVIGTIGMGTNMIMRGPMKAMSEVNQETVADNQLMVSSKMVMLDASNLTAADCDSDVYIEPRPWRTHTDDGPDDVTYGGTPPNSDGGGFLPNEIGTSKRDPWGRQFGYCVWDHGSLSDDAGCGGPGANRLEGTNSPNYPTLAIISAGQDGIFQTACYNFSTADVNADGNLDDPGDYQLVNTPAGSDDMIAVYSYAEAAEDNPDLWNLALVSGELQAQVNANVEFGGANNFFSDFRLTGTEGLTLPDETQLTDADCAGGSAENQIRRNMSGSTATLEVCEGGTFNTLGTGGGVGGTDIGTLISTNVCVSNNITGYWRMEDSNTTAEDITTVHNGTMQGGLDGASNSTSGQVGNALQFDGSDDNIEVTGLMGEPTNITLAAWVDLTTADTGGAEIISIGNYVGLRADDTSGSTSLYGFFSDGSERSTTYVNTLAGAGWTHVAYSIDTTNNVQSLYLNGVQVATSAHTGSIDYTGLGSNTIIGAHGNGGSSNDFNGAIDDVRVYSRAITASEINSIYKFGTEGICTGSIPTTDITSQTTVTQTANMNNTVGTAGWVVDIESDTDNDRAGIAFRIDSDTGNNTTPTAAITAIREADPGIGGLAFKTQGTDGLSDRAYLNRDGKLGLDVTTGSSSSILSNIQIGDHFAGSWNTNYADGVFIPMNSGTNQLAYFGYEGNNDANATMMFSKDLRIQGTDARGLSATEAMRFEQTKVAMFGTPTVQFDGSAKLRNQSNSATTTDKGTLSFERALGTESSPVDITDGGVIGRIVFAGYDGSAIATGGNASIVAVKNPSLDSTPDAFAFTDQTGVALSTQITSNSVTITGIDGNVSVSISGDGSPEFRINGGSWGTSGSIGNGQTLELRLTSSATNEEESIATVSIGSISDDWSVTTVTACTGYVYAGYCYYLGSGTQNCDTVCAGRGGCNQAGVDHINSTANCQAVATSGFGSGPGVIYPSGNGGCTLHYPHLSGLWTGSAACSANSSHGSYRRVCACG